MLPFQGYFWRPTFSLREHFHRSLDLMVQSLGRCKISDISSKRSPPQSKIQGDTVVFTAQSENIRKHISSINDTWYPQVSQSKIEDRKNIEPCLNGIYQGFSNLLEITRKILRSKPLHSYLHVAFETFDSPSADFPQFFQLPRGNFSELPHFLTDRPARILTKKSGDKLIWWFSAYLTPNIDKSQLGHYNWGWFWKYLYIWVDGCQVWAILRITIEIWGASQIMLLENVDHNCVTRVIDLKLSWHYYGDSCAKNPLSAKYPTQW